MCQKRLVSSNFRYKYKKRESLNPQNPPRGSLRFIIRTLLKKKFQKYYLSTQPRNQRRKASKFTPKSTFIIVTPPRHLYSDKKTILLSSLNAKVPQNTQISYSQIFSLNNMSILSENWFSDTIPHLNFFKKSFKIK